MKRSLYPIIISVLLFPSFVASQSQLLIYGVLWDQNGYGLSGLQLNLYISPYIYQTNSSSSGSFTFDNITGVKDERLPAGYSVSENYPNPFNPKTRIIVTLPNSGRVNLNVYNILGQKVIDNVERYYGAGSNSIDIELNGLPNGVYIARITLDGKYSVTKKLMLMYGSQHLSSSGSVSFSQLNKTTLNVNSTLDEKMDSLVVTGSLISKKVFKNLPTATGHLLNLGVLTINIDRSCAGIPTVIYGSKTYNTVQIGSQCWLKENLDIGTMILGNQNQSNNGVIEKYCYNNDPNNCNTNGGLYQWSEAMAYNTIPGTKGICPDGWHIPTYDELFVTLTKEVANSSSTLKARGQGTGNGAGTDIRGFSALLAGSRNVMYSTFYGLGNYTYLWSSTELDASLAWHLYLDSSTKNFGYSGESKEYGNSVRCIKNDMPNAPTLLSPSNKACSQSTSPTLSWNTSTGTASYTLQVSTSSTFSGYVYNQSGLTNTSQLISGLTNSTIYYWRVSATNSYGTSGWSATSYFSAGPLTVSYQNKTYNAIQIGSQCWLKENLDVGTMIQGNQNQTNNATIEKYCYNNDPNNCATYGGLYQWNEALDYNTTPGTKGICPDGWHVPTSTEFQTLNSAVSSNSYALMAIGQGSGSGAGTNASGFSGLFAGYYDYGFRSLGNTTHFWSSTESSAAYANSEFLWSSSLASLSTQDKIYGFSVRCLRDDVDIPNAPTLLSPSNNAVSQTKSPTLSWNTSSGATSYSLQVSTSSTFSSYVFVQSGLTNTSQQISLINDNTYYWRVSATNSFGTSSWSNPWSFNTPRTIPTVPVLSSPANNIRDMLISLTLSWNSSTDASSYTLQVSTSSTFSEYIYNQSGLTNTSQQITGLSTATYYYWRVRATNNFGTSGWSSSWSFRTFSSQPSVPLLLSPADGTSGASTSLTLSWNNIAIASSYALQVSTKTDFSNFIYNQSGLTSASQQITGLNNATMYYWRVSATNSFGTSSWSSSWSFITVSVPCPGTPTISYQGKTYNTVQIGSQCWLKENLDVGTMIQGSQDQTNNSVIEKYCYNNDPNNCATYGGLYQWAETVQYKNGTTNYASANPAFSGNVQGICPPNWHIPTSTEFESLLTSFNNDGKALLSVGIGFGTNASGFSALMAGWGNATFVFLGSYTNFRSSTEIDATFSGTLWLTNYSGITYRSDFKNRGFSVRCVKD